MRVVLAVLQVPLHHPRQQVRPEEVEDALERPRPAEERHGRNEVPGPDVVTKRDDRAELQVEPAEVERQETVLPPAFEQIRPQLRAGPMRQPNGQKADGGRTSDEQSDG
jgi:hypothetical protein